MSIEIEFLPCGDDHGDAICVRFGNDQQGYQIHLIDGGYPIWTMRGKTLCMPYNRQHRSGWSSSEPEAFRTKVEK